MFQIFNKFLFSIHFLLVLKFAKNANLLYLRLLCFFVEIVNFKLNIP